MRSAYTDVSWSKCETDLGICNMRAKEISGSSHISCGSSSSWDVFISETDTRVGALVTSKQ